MFLSQEASLRLDRIDTLLRQIYHPRGMGQTHNAGFALLITLALLNFACALSILAGILVGPTHLKRFQDYLWATPSANQETVQQLPLQLGEEAEVLLGNAYQHMAAVFDEYQMLLKLQGPPGL